MKYCNSAFLCLRKEGVLRFIYFFLSEFSFTDNDDSRDSRGRHRIIFFIPLYHFHPLINIQIFICSFACEMTITFD